MEQKETVRQVGTKEVTNDRNMNVRERVQMQRTGQVVQDIIERFVHGRRTPLVREVLQTKTPDTIAGMFERPSKSECNHLKGSGRFTTHKDYAIRIHTFVDGTTNVKCTLCGEEWKVTDKEAMMMMAETTNTRSSSEQIFAARDTRDIEVEPDLKISGLGRIMSHVMRYANFFYRLREVEELNELQAQGLLSMHVVRARIQTYKDGLKKLGEENDSHR